MTAVTEGSCESGESSEGRNSKIVVREESGQKGVAKERRVASDRCESSDRIDSSYDCQSEKSSLKIHMYICSRSLKHAYPPSKRLHAVDVPTVSRF